MANGILTPCNVARSWNWFRQVTAPCNVACGSGIVTVNSPSGSTLQCDKQLWNHDIQFARWQHPAVWQVALGDDMPLNSPKHPLYWNSTSGFDFDHITAVDMHQSSKFYPNRTTLGRKMTSCRFSRWRISAILDFRNSIMGSLKIPIT